MTELNVWTPLYDTPVVLHTSREQMEALRDELRDVNVFPGWREWFAQQIEAALEGKRVQA